VPTAKIMNLIQVKEELCDCMPAMSAVCDVRFEQPYCSASESS
jgi:hypothetical protein